MPGKRFLYPHSFKACQQCNGKGTVYCSPCNGRGYHETQRYDSSGYSETERTSCAICHGSGERMCNYCGGTGDQLIYQSTESIGNEVNEADTSYEVPGEPLDMAAMKEKYSHLYAEKYDEAQRSRQQIVEWVGQADALDLGLSIAISDLVGRPES